MKTSFFLILVLSLLNFKAVCEPTTQTDNALRIFQNPDPQYWDGFGWSMAAYENKLLVGAPHNDFGAKISGSAYLFDMETGKILHTFHNPDPKENAQFGWPVVVTKQRILIGAHSDGSPLENEGTVHIYDKTTLKHLMKIKCPDSKMTQEFGRSIITFNDKFLVTTLGTMVGNKHVSAFYLFDESGACLRCFYNEKAYKDSSRLGIHIQLRNDTILIGADLSPVDNKKNCGAVYVYDLNGTLHRIIPDPKQKPDDRFGMKSIFVDANIAVCATGDDTITTNSGAVYLFNQSGDLLRTFHNPSPIEGSKYGAPNFGSETALLDKNTILINGMERDKQNRISGVVFAFNTLTGKVVHTFRSPKPELAFGASILSYNKYVLIGSTYADVGDTKEAGCVYLFSVDNPIHR
ncbi:MAG: FG-GAP repeat protein [Candidatus Sumerlaeota bacterium]|nr:FG-GAP repeat protein [Candidatus Sumerlaeota bacterium]